MSEYIIERADFIRFERTIDGNKVYFCITEPKNLEAYSTQTFVTGGLGTKLMIDKEISWMSVFNVDTKIIISGVVKESKNGGTINITHSGDFDFIEMCNGRLVEI